MKKTKQAAMLDKSIRMNLKISEKYALREIGWLIPALLLFDILTIIFSIVAGIYLFLAFRELFDKSLFGEEAYTYAAVPVSMKHVVIGKAIAANYWLMLSFMIVLALVLAVIPFLNGTHVGLSFGEDLLQISAGTFDAVSDGAITEGEIIYDRSRLIHLSVYLILIPVSFLGHNIFLCALFQFAAVVRHIFDPQRNKPFVTAAVAIGAVFGYGLVMIGVVGGLDYLISGDDITAWTAILEIVIGGGSGIALLAASVRLLERKYNLY